MLMLLFVAYQLWGTGLQEAASQRDLKDEFGAMLEQRPGVTRPSTTATTGVTTTTGRLVTVPPAPPATPVPANVPLPDVGDPVATIQIPRIGVTKTVVQGVTLAQLKRGPGHYPETPLPGQKGNAGIAGHRTTYGAPFYDIDGLALRDEIVVTTLQGTFRYQVDSKLIVAPSDVSVLADKGDNRLTLTACHPRYSARQRIVVSGVLVGKPAPRLEDQDRSEPDKQASSIRDAGGLDGARPSSLPAALWGCLCALVWLIAWAISRLLRRRAHRRVLSWVPYLVGAPVFLVLLYVFFENFSRLLPSNF